METALNLLITHLDTVRDQLKGRLHHELQTSLHIHEKGILPDVQMTKLAATCIDLLHEVEQLLEPGHLVLADHFLGYVNAQCLRAAVELKIPDILRARESLTVEELASASNARADRLRQVMRILHNSGIFVYDCGTDTYSNNHTSALLCRDHWTQWHNWVELYDNQFYDIARGIPASLQKDAIRWPAQINYDTDDDMFTYFKKRGWVPQLHRTLGGGATAQAPGIVADYPWHEVAHETVIDIGGGGGALIALLLRSNKTMIGGVYDLPHVIDHITPFFHSADGQFSDVKERIPIQNLIGGNFFDSIPPSKVYTMKWTLHDWKDAEATTILRNIGKAIIPSPTSRLIVMESILGDGRSSRLSRYADINMMMTANGLERTLRDWEVLAANSGWKIVKVRALRTAWPCAIEMRPVELGGSSERPKSQLGTSAEPFSALASQGGEAIA